VNTILAWPRDFIGAWNRFFFTSRTDDTLAILGLFRIVFSLVMVFCYASRIPDLLYFFGEWGILSSDHRNSLSLSDYRWVLFGGSAPDWAVHALHGLFLGSLVCLAVGLMTRTSAIIVYLLQISFLHRNMGVVFGVDMISTYFFLYLVFAQSGARFSLDSLIRRRQGLTEETHGWVSHLSWRLMQIQLCVIYAFSGWEKLKGTRWWDGSALWDVLSIGNMQRWDLSFVAHAPLLLALSVYVVLLWEIYFPVLVWLRKFRLPMLFFGFIMHVKIILFMNLPSFGAMMISLYILFLKPHEIQYLLARSQTAWRALIPSRN
jgi:hypothetical protein